MRHILLILFFFISISVYSQKFNFSISASYNQTFIADIEKTAPNSRYPLSSGYSSVFYSKIKENYQSNSGAKIQGSISYKLNAKLFIESGLQISMHRFNKLTYIEPLGSEFSDDIIISNSDTSGIIVGEFPTYSLENKEKVGDTRTIYTEIPIKIGYAFLNSRLKCKLGILTSFLAYADVYEFNNYFNSDPYYNEMIIDVEKNTSADGFKNLMFNGNIEIDYLVYRSFGLNLSYLYSLNSIYDKDASIGKPKYNLLSIGVSYNF